MKKKSPLTKRILLAFAVIFFVSNLSFSQNAWSTREKVFSDGNITVWIEFYLTNTSCSAGKKNKFRYIVDGQLDYGDRYVVWSLIFKDCSTNKPMYLQQSVNIGRGGIAHPTDYIESPAYNFSANGLIDRYKIFDAKTIGYEPYTSYPQPVPSGWGIDVLTITITGKNKICSGDNVFITSKVENNTTGVSYEWQKSTDKISWKKIEGASSANYRTAAIYNTTHFRCICREIATGLESVSDILTANVADPEVKVTGATSACSGGKVTLTAQSSDFLITGNYQWENSTDQYSWSLIPGATSTTYNTPPLSATSYFRCTFKPVSTYCKQALSNVAAVNIVREPIVSITGGGTICEGNPASLSAEVTGGVFAGNYQWQSSSNNSTWSSIPFATSSAFYISDLRTTTYYRTQFTPTVGGCKTVTSYSKMMKVVEAPKVEMKSKDVVIAPGKDVHLKATGSWKFGAGTYQWQSSTDKYYWKDIYAANTDKYTTPKLNTTTFYQCVYKAGSINCEGKSNVVAVQVDQKLERKWTASGGERNSRKRVHLGFDLGVEYIQQPLNVNVREQTAGVWDSPGKQTMSTNGFGYRADFIFDALARDKFSWGFAIGGGGGTSPLLYGGGKSSSTSKKIRETYAFYMFDLQTEMAVGFYVMKVLVKYKSSMQLHDITRTEWEYSEYYSTEYKSNTHMRKETINAGLRFGPFRRFSLDLLWSFNNDYDFDWNTFDWNYNSLTGFYHGVELDLYIRNAVRFGIAAAFYPSEKTPLNVSGDSARYLRAFFTYNFDRFK